MRGGARDIGIVPGVIRWQSGEQVSEQFQIFDNTLQSYHFPTTFNGIAAPAGALNFQGAINKEGFLRSNINDEAGTAIVLTPVLDEWVSLDDSLPEVASHAYCYLVSAAPLAGIYEARFMFKRP